MIERIENLFNTIAIFFQKVGIVWLLALTPLYLFLTYTKLDESDSISYFIIMSIIFILYLPIQIIASEKNLSISFHLIYNDDDILKIVAISSLFVIGFFILYISAGLGIIIIYSAWLILQMQLYRLYKSVTIIVGTHSIWPPHAFTLGHLTHNDLAS